MKLSTVFVFALLTLTTIGSCQKKKTVDTYHVTPKNVDEMFKDFFARFASDSVYQKKQIRFPLPYVYTDIEDHMEETIIQESNWSYIDFTQDGISDDSGIDEFEVIITREYQGFIYLRRGIDNGIYIEYHFEDSGEVWVLTRIHNQST